MTCVFAQAPPECPFGFITLRAQAAHLLLLLLLALSLPVRLVVNHISTVFVGGVRLHKEKNIRVGPSFNHIALYSSAGLWFESVFNENGF